MSSRADCLLIPSVLGIGGRTAFFHLFFYALGPSDESSTEMHVTERLVSECSAFRDEIVVTS